MTKVEKLRALRIIAGCPDGVTDYALWVINNVHPSILFDLMKDQLIEARQEHIKMKDGKLTRTRCRISTKGRELINNK